jgi:autotransporter-associated beta strand protein
MRPRKIPFILSATSALLLAPSSFAGNTWDGGGADGNWTNNLNWNSNTLPDYATLLTYGGSVGLASSNNSATSSIAGITFSSGAGAFTLSGSSVTLGGNITNNSSVNQTINLPLVLSGNRNISNSSGAVTLGGQISGAFNIIKSGTNTLTLNSAGSSFSRLQINAGTVRLGINDASSPTGGLTFATATTATLDLNGKTQSLGSTVVFGGTAGTAAITDSAGGGLLKLGGEVTQQETSSPLVNISAALDLNGATRSFNTNNSNGIITVSGAIGNSSGTAGLTKAGEGTLTLSGTNTFNGNTTVSAGLLTLGNSLALQNSTLDTTGSSASSSATNGLKTTVTALTMGGLSGNKNLASLFDAGNGYGGVTSLTLNPASGQTPSYSGLIDNGASGMTLTKTGLGIQTLTGANSYTGGTTVASGVLSVNNTTGSGTGVGPVTVGAGGTLSGTGISTGAVNVSGVLSPGTNIESFGTGALALNSGSSFKYEINTATVGADLLHVSGGLNISSNVTLNLTDLATLSQGVADGTKFTLISYTGTWNDGTFMSYADDSTFFFAGNQWQINYNADTGGSNFASDQNGATGFVTLTAIPEPSSAGLLGLGGFVALLMRRRCRNSKFGVC